MTQNFRKTKTNSITDIDGGYYVYHFVMYQKLWCRILLSHSLFLTFAYGIHTRFNASKMKRSPTPQKLSTIIVTKPYFSLPLFLSEVETNAFNGRYCWCILPCPLQLSANPDGCFVKYFRLLITSIFKYCFDKLQQFSLIKPTTFCRSISIYLIMVFTHECFFKPLLGRSKTFYVLWNFWSDNIGQW